jgi:hypothetical protein
MSFSNLISTNFAILRQILRKFEHHKYGTLLSFKTKQKNLEGEFAYRQLEFGNI